MLTFNDSDGMWHYSNSIADQFLINCLWTLTAPQDMLIELNITQLNHEWSEYGFDYVCAGGSLEVTPNTFLSSILSQILLRFNKLFSPKKVFHQRRYILHFTEQFFIWETHIVANNYMYMVIQLLSCQILIYRTL